MQGVMGPPDGFFSVENSHELLEYVRVERDV